MASESKGPGRDDGDRPRSSAGAEDALDAAPRSFDPIYFGFNSHSLTRDAQDALVQLGEYLRDHPSSSVVISGHADERGTTEYNIALGQNRAQQAVKYLERMGVDGRRIQSISYGEERPAVEGSGEDAWARNRRDEFDVAASGSRR